MRARVQLANGDWGDRIPAWIKWATQEWNEIQFNGAYYEPPEKGQPGACHAVLLALIPALVVMLPCDISCVFARMTSSRRRHRHPSRCLAAVCTAAQVSEQLRPAAGVYDENKSYVFKYPRPKRPRALRVYECHVGMSSEEEKVNSYLEFRNDMVPRIRQLGYNTIQIMAIQVRALSTMLPARTAVYAS